MAFPIVSLLDISKITMGQSPPGDSYNDQRNGIPLFQGKAEFGEVYPVASRWCTRPTRIARKGDILLSVRAPVGPTNIADQDCCIGRGLSAIQTKQDLAKQRYLYYYFKFIEPLLSNRGQGSTFSAINKAEVETIQIPLPPLSEQRRIVEILDQADTLRKKRAEADAKAERILPALFIKMFGDPISNPYNWDIVSLKDLFSDEKAGTKCGPFGSALKRHEYVDKGIPVWGIDNVAPNAFVEKGSLFITQDKYEELTSYSVDSGDILISRAGTVGRMCVAYPKQSPSIIGTNLIRLSLNSKEIAPEYFSSMFTYFPDRVGQLRVSSDESAYSFMNTSVLKSLNIPLPPFKLQQVFVSSIHQLRLQNRKAADSGKVLETLFQTLLHRAFSGDLTAEWRKAHMAELLQEMEHQARVLGLEHGVEYEQLGMLE